jgi:hypothetical protein
MSAFIVPTGDSGNGVGTRFKKMGLRSSRPRDGLPELPHPPGKSARKEGLDSSWP